MSDAPEWFVQAYWRSFSQKSEARTDPPGRLWREMSERGWEGQRLTGGQRRADGTLTSPKKLPTLVVPATEEMEERPT